MSNEDWEDPFDQESVPSLSFDEKKYGVKIGHEFKFKVLKRAEMVQSRDYDTGDPATWPDGNKKMSAVLKVEILGERPGSGKWTESEQDGERTIWAGKPSKMFTALADGQREAGAKFEPSGTGVLKWIGEEPHKDKKKNALKLYAVKYTPPVPDDPFEGETVSASTGLRSGGSAPDDDEPPF